MAAGTVPSLQVKSTDIGDAKLIVLRIHQEYRGFSSETHNKEGLTAPGTNREFIQDSHSLSVGANLVRGLGLQIPPFEQGETAAAPSQDLVP